MVLRFAKAIMVAALSAFCLMVAWGNISDYGSNYEFVRHVMSMDTTFPGNALTARAIRDPQAWTLAYAGIIAAEAGAGLLLAAGSAVMLARLSAPAAVFERAKTLAYLGGLIAFLLWFFGFMVVAGEYFAMWQSREWNGQEAAFRFYVAVLGVMILLALPEREA